MFSNPALRDFMLMTDRWRWLGPMQRLAGTRTAGSSMRDIVAYVRDRVEDVIVEDERELAERLLVTARSTSARSTSADRAPARGGRVRPRHAARPGRPARQPMEARRLVQRLSAQVMCPVVDVSSSASIVARVRQPVPGVSDRPARTLRPGTRDQ